METLCSFSVELVSWWFCCWRVQTERHLITPPPTSILHWKPLCSTVPSPWSNNNIRNHNTSAQSQETYRLLLPTHFFFFCDFKLLKVCFVFKFINTPTRPPLLSHYANQFMLLWILVFPLGQLFVSLSVCLPVCVSKGLNIVVYTFRLVTLMVYLISFAAAAHPSYKKFGCDVARGRNFQYNIIFGQSLNCFFNDGSAVSFLLPRSPYFNIIPI